MAPDLRFSTGNNIENFEFNISLFRFINDNHTEFLDYFFLLFRYFGRAEVIILILIFLFLRKRREDFFLLLFASLITAILVVLLKFILDVPRPAAFLDNVHLLLPYYKRSFPSGDTAVASLILLFFYRRVNFLFKILLFVYWFLISYGRIYLGVHYPLDIVAGFCISLFAIILSHFYICKKFIYCLIAIDRKN